MEKTKKGVRLEHISKIYKDPKTNKDFYAVKDTSLEIKPGSFVTLLGPSGCGKTTLLRCFNRMHDLYKGNRYTGEIIFKNKNILDKNIDMIKLKSLLLNLLANA